jgi:hypothetical protein
MGLADNSSYLRGEALINEDATWRGDQRNTARLEKRLSPSLPDEF